jgi:hypothetical protein
MAQANEFGSVLTGQIQIYGGPPADGYVLTSDANGVGTWQLPADVSSPANVLQIKLNAEVFA